MVTLPFKRNGLVVVIFVAAFWCFLPLKLLLLLSFHVCNMHWIYQILCHGYVPAILVFLDMFKCAKFLEFVCVCGNFLFFIWIVIFLWCQLNFIRKNESIKQNPLYWQPSRWHSWEGSGRFVLQGDFIWIWIWIWIALVNSFPLLLVVPNLLGFYDCNFICIILILLSSINSTGALTNPLKIYGGVCASVSCCLGHAFSKSEARWWIIRWKDSFVPSSVITWRYGSEQIECFLLNTAVAHETRLLTLVNKIWSRKSFIFQ